MPVMGVLVAGCGRACLTTSVVEDSGRRLVAVFGYRLGSGLVAFTRVRTDVGGQAGRGFGCRSSIRPRGGGMVMCDRDRAGSIKGAAAPPAGGSQTPARARIPVTSEPAHAAPAR